MKQDKFLSNIMGQNCGVADFSVENDLDNLNTFRFAYSKTKISTSNSLYALKHNFYLADITVKLNHNVAINYEFLSENSEITIATKLERESVIKLAENSFVYDRFHSDPHISDEVASKIKGQWIENYFNGERGDKCFVLLDKHKVKGFLLTVIKNDEVVIDLIAVDKRQRKEGVGVKLINGMIAYYKKDYQKYSVGTQLSNVASINLYKKCGFNITEYGLVWHYFSRT